MNKDALNIVIADYGVGNLHSLRRAFRHAGAEAVVSEDADTIRKADALVLPGVGSFEAGMRGLSVRGLRDEVKKFAESGKPMLGICLGAQLLLSKGFEFGEHKGLGIIEGEVIHFPKQLLEKVPHIGWNRVCEEKAGAWKGSFLETFQPEFDAYFVHSYILKPADMVHSFAKTEYGGFTFSSVIRKGNIYGCQFHPEKSGESGLKLILRFVELASSREFPR